MESWLGHDPMLGLVATSIAIFLGFSFLVARRYLIGTHKKSHHDKLLLKELLEEFDLDIPLELQGLNKRVIKSIEKS